MTRLRVKAAIFCFAAMCLYSYKVTVDELRTQLVIALAERHTLSQELRLAREAVQDSRQARATSSEWPKSFEDIANRVGTDKAKGPSHMAAKNFFINATHPKCQVGQNHFYHTMYQRWLGGYSSPDAKPFQFLEIGFYTGLGYTSFREFLPTAEMHGMEVSCLPPADIEWYESGKPFWPKKWGNMASNHPEYEALRAANRLHCGDGSAYEFLDQVWRAHMSRRDAPPLMVVVDDASHIASHMVQTVFFWLPRIEPGGVLIVEDIEPSHDSNGFRSAFMSQIIQDVHACGRLDENVGREPIFPALRPFLHSVHCEMHICVFERSAEPSQPNFPKELGTPPAHALSPGLIQ